MNEKIPLSVVVIARNEQENIGRALSSVAWVSDIVVYDSGSTDQTVEIAKKMGANVVQGPWFGFGKTKQKATEYAKHDWVLSLDSDEEVSLQLKEEILRRFSGLDSKVAYRFPRLSYFLGRWIRHGGWYPDLQTRLFNRTEAGWNDADIHEKIQASSYANFVSDLNHYVFKDIAAQVQTNNRYSGLQAETMFKDGKRFSWFHFLTKPTVKFVECYFLKLGFLDAWPGFVIARNAAHSVFMKWAKLRELQGGFK